LFNSVGRRGSAAVEFVLVLWVLTLVLLFTVELGLALNVRLLVTGAAREGARRAAVDGGDTATARQAVAKYLALAGVTAGDSSVTVKPARASYGTAVRVSVEVNYRWRTPPLRQLLGQTITIKAEAVSRSEKVRTGT
jgi:Flp pilus assembly protein TadG